ncbi:MAG: iron-sulfur cluster assembly protein, partial [Aeromicrobium sp.]
MAVVTEEQILEALKSVNDPEIKRPITELGMVDGVSIDGNDITVRLLLTVSGCPLKDTLNRDITAAVATVASASVVTVDMGVMSDEQ